MANLPTIKDLLTGLNLKIGDKLVDAKFTLVDVTGAEPLRNHEVTEVEAYEAGLVLIFEHRLASQQLDAGISQLLSVLANLSAQPHKLALAGGSKSFIYALDDEVDNWGISLASGNAVMVAIGLPCYVVDSSTRSDDMEM